jgi:putative transposase
MTMCRVLNVARAGFYAWLHNPVSARDKDNQRLLMLIRDSYSLSGGVYGYRRVHGDLNEIGETCGKNRVGRIMQQNRIKAVRGYKAPRRIAGRPSVVAPNRVQRQFTVVRANQVWVTDITYIRTWQGWLYLAVVIDLFARNVVGWSMKPTLSRELALDALMMAVWRRKPDGEVIVHSDQGSQYGSDDWQRFCRANNLAPSMSRRGNCWDNAVAESFFSSLKKSGSENASIKPGIWPGPISSITLKCSTTGPGATVTSAASGLRTGLIVRTEFVYGRGVSPVSPLTPSVYLKRSNVVNEKKLPVSLKKLANLPMN